MASAGRDFTNGPCTTYSDICTPGYSQEPRERLMPSTREATTKPFKSVSSSLTASGKPRLGEGEPAGHNRPDADQPGAEEHDGFGRARSPAGHARGRHRVEVHGLAAEVHKGELGHGGATVNAKGGPAARAARRAAARRRRGGTDKAAAPVGASRGRKRAPEVGDRQPDELEEQLDDDGDREAGRAAGREVLGGELGGELEAHARLRASGRGAGGGDRDHEVGGHVLEGAAAAQARARTGRTSRGRGPRPAEPGGNTPPTQPTPTMAWLPPPGWARSEEGAGQP